MTLIELRCLQRDIIVAYQNVTPAKIFLFGLLFLVKIQIHLLRHETIKNIHLP